nr:hypothetical protein [Candidatus Binatus sp.]
MSVIPMARDAAVPLAFRLSKINREQPATRLQDPSYLADTFLACLVWQMVKHDCAQDDIESRIGKWYCLDRCRIERQLDAGLSRFLARPRNHLRRRVDPIHLARLADAPLRCDCQSSGTAAYIQNRLAGCDARQIDLLLTKR